MAEEPRATWEKRFEQAHYSYRDFHRVTTTLFPLGPVDPGYLQALVTLSPTVYYAFGANARVISAYNWPRLGDWPLVMPCYAREVMVKCDQDVWVRIVSVNPEYIKQAMLQVFTKVTPTAPQTILEVEHLVDTDDMVTFYPTYGAAIVFRADSAAGSLKISAEGNVEGGE